MLNKNLRPAWLLFLFVLGCGAASAAEIALGGVVPGSGLVHKRVVSLREAPFVNIVRQETDFSCGAAALATLLKYAYGLNTNEAEVVRGMLALSDPDVVRRQGFSLLNMRDYVQSLDMRGRGLKVPLEALLSIKVPTIVLLEIRGYKHFVVLKKTTREIALLADPALGNVSLPLADFASGWNGMVFAVVGDSYDDKTSLREPPKQADIRKLFSATVRMPDAPPVDFGYLHADLFRQ